MPETKKFYQEDYSFIQKLLSGESEAWNKFYREIRKKLEIYLNKKFPNVFNTIFSEEVVDGVEKRLIANDFKVIREYRGECSFSSYLTKATDWEVFSWIKKHSEELTNEPLENIDNLNTGNEVSFSSPIEKDSVPDIVSGLTDDLRFTFLLRYYDYFGFPLNEIRLLAKKKNVPISSITEKISRFLEPAGRDILDPQRNNRQAFREKMTKICYKIHRLNLMEHKLDSCEDSIEKLEERRKAITERMALEERRDNLLKNRVQLIITTPYEIIAEILGERQLNTIRSRVFLAKKQLKQKISTMNNQHHGPKRGLKE